MFEEEVFPDTFKDTVPHMIFKGKCRKEQLQDNRFVRCKMWLTRLAEGLLVEGGMKGPLVEKSSMYQVGGQAWHRPEELLFAFKSVLARYHSTKKVVVGQCHNVAKFFDKEVAADTLDVMYRRQVDPKICRLCAKLNNTRIQVRTKVGVTEKADIGLVIGQGTMGGVLASQASLNDGIDGQFHGSQ